jgi:hypothetical protein
MSEIESCVNHYVGQSLIKPTLTGLLFQESEKHLYMLDNDTYLYFNFCPRCGEKLDKEYPCDQ